MQDLALTKGPRDYDLPILEALKKCGKISKLIKIWSKSIVSSMFSLVSQESNKIMMSTASLKQPLVSNSQKAEMMPAILNSRPRLHFSILFIVTLMQALSPSKEEVTSTALSPFIKRINKLWSHAVRKCSLGHKPHIQHMLIEWATQLPFYASCHIKLISCHLLDFSGLMRRPLSMHPPKGKRISRLGYNSWLRLSRVNLHRQLDRFTKDNYRSMAATDCQPVSAKFSPYTNGSISEYFHSSQHHQ